ncbi:MAG: PLP-dependent aminotransferase family protein [Pseudomonadota bacterium]
METQSGTLGWQPHYADRMAGMQASEIRELLKMIEQPGLVSFAGGIPDPALFPQEEIRHAYDEVLASADSAAKALQYSPSEGDDGLRDWITGYMTARGVPCTRDNILITSGSQQALEFLGRLLISPGDTALVTAPTYLGALQAFSGNQPRYDRLGLHPTNCTAASYADAAHAAGGRVALAYIVPDFANPTGETVTKVARADLIETMRDGDVPIIEDNPYGALRFEGTPVPSVQALDVAQCGSIDRSRVIYCGSFSKIFTPGLRVGWVCAAREVVTRLTLIKQASDLNSPRINQLIMLHLAESVYAAQVAKVIAAYRTKRDAMLAALDAHMPDGVAWSHPEGGMFIWVTLPDHVDAATLLQEAVSEAQVAFVPGRAFFADGSGANTMRLSYTMPARDQIDSAIARLAKVLSAAIGR